MRLAFALALLLLGCSTLPMQRRLAGYVSVAHKECDRNQARCQDAKACSDAALPAARALQRERTAIASGRDDLEASVLASRLSEPAEALCKSLGFEVPR